jgi:hypothetical protein
MTDGMPSSRERSMLRRGQLDSMSRAGLVDHAMALERQARDFTRDVVRKAFEYAVRYDWCDQVAACLEELGIKMGKPRVHFKVVVTYDVTAEMPYDDLASLTQNGPEYLRRHMHVPSLLVASGPLQVEHPEGFVDPEEIRLDSHELLPPLEARPESVRE